MTASSRGRIKAQRGLSLVEMMVGLVVGMLVVVAVLGLIVRMSMSRSEVDRTGRQIEHGRYAIHKLAEDLRHAGYFGEFSDLGVPDVAALALDPCSTGAANLKTLMAVPVRPYTAVATGSRPTCIPASDFVDGSNVLVLRFASPRVMAPGSLDPNLLYVQTNVGGSIIARGDVSPPLDTFTLTRQTALPGAPVPGPIQKYVVRIYFLSPCSQAGCTSTSDGGTPIPTLKMIELDSSGGAPGFSAPVAIAEGVERLEFDYGIDTDADGAPNRFTDCETDCTTGDDVANIVTVTAYAVVRDGEATAGFSDTKSYVLGQAGTYTPTGTAATFRRHLYSSTLRLNNISMRRE
jgi:type IV pilus assembly protein PilW